jgi:hypothetical protein
VMMIASLLFTLAMFVSLSSIGGILGAKLFVERDR